MCDTQFSSNYECVTILMWFINLYAVPLLRSHGVDVKPPLIVDSRSQIGISWNPQDVLPTEDDPDTYKIDVYVYTYEYEKSIWTQKSVNHNLPNNGRAVLGQIEFSGLMEVVAIHVTTGEVISTSDDLARVIALLSGRSPFPSRAGIWSGLLFSIDNKREVTDEEAATSRNENLGKLCSKWGDRQSRMPLPEVFTPLPACPPTQDRAELPNSGLEEVKLDSVLYNTNYHTQWIETFNPGASKCFTQATVMRLVIYFLPDARAIIHFSPQW